MRVLFLDIDGVLNGSYYGENAGFVEPDVPLDAECVSRLKRFLESEPDVKIVWSTNWRHHSRPAYNGYRNPRIYLENLDWMKGRIIGSTPSKMSSEHFHDVKWWLDSAKDVDSYVIFEDGRWPDEWFGTEDRIVRCDSEKGLTDDDIALAKRILETRSGNDN